MADPKPYADPSHPGNSPKHLTGKLCVERGCGKPAGTAWSPYWCMACNVKRFDRIDAGLERVMRELEAPGRETSGGTET